jgi:hypothetical protein
MLDSRAQSGTKPTGRTMARTQQEINELGFAALVDALGKEDAIRFVRQFATTSTQKSREDEEVTLPPMTADEAHELINKMHSPYDQVSLL